LGLEDPSSALPLYPVGDYLRAERRSDRVNFVLAEAGTLSDDLLREIHLDDRCVLILQTDNEHGMPALRRAFLELMDCGVRVPVVIRRHYDGISEETFALHGATDCGGLLVDGLGDGIWLEAPSVPIALAVRTSLGVLQATRTRISKTEYISCPSCGRTLFDLQETTAAIRGRTDHLKGVKIAVMGCIVNGPGEMADADYGYVGSGPGKISLYRGRDVVRANVPTAAAVDELIDLIVEDGRWVDPRTQTP
jgi:(E)-4-hydroxy-3-methylbut-2-enyl-diphosphate synthase